VQMTVSGLGIYPCLLGVARAVEPKAARCSPYSGTEVNFIGG
jgi:hypothetical protein